MTNNKNAWLSSIPIAHRGLHDSVIPENSLAAFSAAVASGYAIELDIHISLDDVVFVHHDENTLRMTGTDCEIRKTNSVDLASLTLGNNEHISTLREVLALITGNVPLLIEIKTGPNPSHIGRLIRTIVSDYNGDIAIQSFDPLIIAWFKRNMPEIFRGQLSSSFRDKQMNPIKKFIAKNMLLNWLTKPDFIAYEIETIENKAVGFWVRRLHVPLLAWTVRDDEALKKSRSFGANVIFEGIVLK